MADHVAADAALEAMIARIRSLPELGLEAAPAAAEAVRAELERQIAAGTTPEGEAWAPRKAGGGPVLRGAAQALGVGAVGSTIVLRLRGPEARHHLGRAKGGMARRILPTQGIPRRIAAAIKGELDAAFQRHMGAR